MLTCGGGGLRDILIDSDAYAYASVDQCFLENNLRELYVGWHLYIKRWWDTWDTWWCPSLRGVNRKPILSVENFRINSFMCRFLWGDSMDIHEKVLEII